MERKVVKAVVGTLLVLGAVAPAWPAIRKEPAKPLIQVGLLLDTSNSMDGLIDQAKTQLWKLVNEFATAQKDGKNAELLVALYEYGKSSIPSQEGYLRMIVPFTADLDKVSEELFALGTNGGDEYCGKVIKSATEGLAWNSSGQNLKVIFIAGNEPFTQGDVDYRKACKEAVSRGIVINTIFCGNYEEGVRTNWKDGADLADGRYMNIDQNQRLVHIDAPQDKEISRLSQALNRTYVPYGALGEKGKERQEMQDRNARNIAGAVLAERAVAKASSQYRNTGWDLVDAVKEGKVKITEMKDEELPEKMRGMSQEERKVYVESQAKEREKIQSSINRLNDERKKYVAQELARTNPAGANTLDAVMIKTVREQAGQKNFQFK